MLLLRARDRPRLAQLDSGTEGQQLQLCTIAQLLLTRRGLPEASKKGTSVLVHPLQVAFLLLLS